MFFLFQSLPFICQLHCRYTCDECIQGLEWVEAYIEDPIMIAEYVVYLEQNFCLGELRSYSNSIVSDVLRFV